MPEAWYALGWLWLVAQCMKHKLYSLETGLRTGHAMFGGKSQVGLQLLLHIL